MTLFLWVRIYLNISDLIVLKGYHLENSFEPHLKGQEVIESECMLSYYESKSIWSCLLGGGEFLPVGGEFLPVGGKFSPMGGKFLSVEVNFHQGIIPFKMLQMIPLIILIWMNIANESDLIVWGDGHYKNCSESIIILSKSI